MQLIRQDFVTTGHDDEAGYALVETLVAFAILAGSIVIALSSMTLGLQNLQKTRDVKQASAVAVALFELAKTDKGSHPRLDEGTMKGWKWRAEYSPLQGSIALFVQPKLLRISISDAAGRPIPQATLESILILPK